MKEGSSARYKRKLRKEQGYDEEDLEDEDFEENLEEALKNHGKNVTVRGIEDQVKYFGHAIEPFNMREE